MKLEQGQQYTRRQIHEALGGNIEKYLPHVDGKVVCGCFDPEKNPEAPLIVLPGNSQDRMRWAAVFAAQQHFVPCFLKRGMHAWEYIGDYRVNRRSEDKNEIALHSRRTGRPEISQVLHLEPLANTR